MTGMQQYRHVRWMQSGEDAQDALICRSLSTKEPLIIGHFYGNSLMKIRYPTYLHHPVCDYNVHNVSLGKRLICDCNQVLVIHYLQYVVIIAYVGM